MVGCKVIIFALTLTSYTTWVQANNVGIIGGKSVSIENAPFVVALYRNGEAIGAGSIVHEQFILTSGSIVERANNTFQVLVGSDSLTSCGYLVDVNKTLCHEKYAEENDICLLKLSVPVQFGPKINKVNLPEKNIELQVGFKVNITGWGKMEDGSSPDKLQQTEIQLLYFDDCSPLYPTMDNEKLCAGARGHNACMGDGGAPMTFKNNVQIGLASLGYDYECSIHPAIYTKVSKYVDWINSTINDNL